MILLLNGVGQVIKPVQHLIYNDVREEKIENNFNTFTFSSLELFEVEQLILLGETKDLYTIKFIDEDNGEYHYDCENASTADLINDYIFPGTYAGLTLKQAMETVLDRSEWEVGLTESTELRSFEWDYITLKEALVEVADAFGVELEFNTEFNGSMIKQKRVDALAKRGMETFTVFEAHHDITSIKKEVRSTITATAAYVAGKDGLNLTGYVPPASEWTEKYINKGNFIANKDAALGATKQRFGLVQNTSLDNPYDLWKEACEFLDKYSEPEVVYHVDVLLHDQKHVSIGDTIIIKDFTVEGEELILEARVLEERKGTDLHEVVLGEYIKHAYVLNDDIKALQEAIKDLENTVNNLPDLDGSTITQSNNRPQNPKDGQLWLDTSQQPYIIYRWDATLGNWFTLNEAPENIYVSPIAPEVPYTNQFWLDTSLEPNRLMRWNASIGEWVPTFNELEDVVEAVSQSNQLASMFNQKADRTELDTLATVDDVNDRFEQVETQTNAQLNSLDNRIQPLTEQVGTIETRLSTLPGELALNFTGTAAGINLLRNSIGFAASKDLYDADGVIRDRKIIDFWNHGETLATQAEWDVLTSNRDETMYGSYWTSAPNPTRAAKAYQAVNGLEFGKSYTISGLFRRGTTSTDVALVRVYYKDSSGVMRQLGATIGLTTVSTEWKVASTTFTTPSTQVYVQLEVRSQVYGTTAITGLMLNKGDLPYGWTSHIEEVYTTGISFNMNGIKVDSGNNYTRMTSTEFAGYTETNPGEYERIFSLNGDTTEVANLQAQYEIRMGRVKIRSVNTGWSFLPN